MPDVVVGAGRLLDALPGAGHDGLEGGGHLTLPVTENKYDVTHPSLGMRYDPPVLYPLHPRPLLASAIVTSASV